MPENKSEISGKFLGRGCREFARPQARIIGTGHRRKITAHNCGQKPQESPQLRRVQCMGSYAAARRTGCPTMIRKQEKGHFHAANDVIRRIRGRGGSVHPQQRCDALPDCLSGPHSSLGVRRRPRGARGVRGGTRTVAADKSRRCGCVARDATSALRRRSPPLTAPLRRRAPGAGWQSLSRCSRG
jgi:hypothetical protein